MLLLVLYKAKYNYSNTTLKKKKKKRNVILRTSSNGCFFIPRSSRPGQPGSWGVWPYVSTMQKKRTEKLNLVQKRILQFNTECHEICQGLDELIKSMSLH